ncbi:MAG TPA: ABC transporter ATP-binding protein [Ignavibacteria bacterium]|nr:ABC transporter ATP-binding protein [Ignavibacteria bacterium]HRF66611.1 ABC transporter ATP-binding protein [Ignavibacteria bacterium]HRJ04465.1 ABC transporter ATP-binding protein [Ignavibacteria bacterium]HRJ86645.1 ABC transporter ATP-binding protein [Ignavibacteria bacterium]
MLKVENLHVNYGAINAIKGLSIHVPEKSIITLIGANGAGKTTTLRAISSIVKAAEGSKIVYMGEDITNLPAHKIVEKGLCQVPEGRLIFANLTVKENLDMGAYLRKDKQNFAADLDLIFSIFPRLKERIKQPGGTLSGGEQQMLAISRALMSKPKMLLLDEPSLGIAPLLTKTIFEKIVEINKTLGMTILLVEQNANLALSVADYGYVIETGNIILEGPAKELESNPEVRKAYLGET